MKGIQEIQCVWILVKYLILCPMKPSAEKLVQIGLEKSINMWAANWLEDRKQRVMINSNESNWKDFVCFFFPKVLK